MVSEGPNSPGTMANDSAAGIVEWTNVDNAKVEDESVATLPNFISTYVSNYLKATNFGFSIPTGATIDGIQVDIKKNYRSTSTIRDEEVKIVKSDGSIGSVNKGETSTDWPSVLTYTNYGGSSDLWGENWSASDINDSDFGAVINADIYLHPAGGAVDHIRITVYYTTPGGSNSPGTMANDTSILGNAWSNVDNAKVSDDTYATVTINDEACFLYNTKILTIRKDVFIQNIKVGDKILSLDDKEVCVTKVIKRKSSSYFELKTDIGTTEVTGEHPYLLKNGEISQVRKLKTGDILKGVDGDIKVISNSKIIKSVDVYNLSVEKPNIYIANGIYVHNKPV